MAFSTGGCGRGCFKNYGRSGYNPNFNGVLSQRCPAIYVTNQRPPRLVQQPRRQRAAAPLPRWQPRYSYHLNSPSSTFSRPLHLRPQSSSDSGKESGEHGEILVTGKEGQAGGSERGRGRARLWALATPVAIAIWATSIGALLFINYYEASSPWPSILLALDVREWALFHAVSNSLFAGGIFTTTFLEWAVFQSKSSAVREFWFSTASKAEAALVLPGLTGSIVSGIAQAWLKYQCPIKYAPLYVKLPVHVLTLFGLWWLATDLTTRDAAHDEGKQLWRQGSNLVSCMLLICLYGIMVLKPDGLS